MPFIAELDEAWLHRELYVAIMRSALQQPGSKTRLAEQIGVSPVYLSYIMASDYDGTLRDPSPGTIARIAEHLPAPREEREAVRYHMSMAREQERRGRQGFVRMIRDCDLRDIARDVGDRYEDFTYARSAGEYASMAALEAYCSLTIHSVPWYVDPVSFAKVCLVAHNADGVLNLRIDNLWHAKLARAILQDLESRWPGLDYDAAQYLLANAMCAEAKGYRDFGLNKESLKVLAQAEAMAQAERTPAWRFWEPHIYLSQIRALYRTRRFPITEVEMLAGRVRESLDYAGYKEWECRLWSLWLDCRVSEAYLRRGGERNRRKAEALLYYQWDSLESLPRLGPNDRVLLMKTLGRLHQAAHDHQGARGFLDQALAIAQQNNLDRQVDQVRQLLQESPPAKG